ncbi:MAG: M17 family peptidase N-terminal domain-containing protein [Myxococcota bacterium]|nr:M17 family peptidase N-terminal domain-containing protein [Myxococcota bacterium]
MRASLAFEVDDAPLARVGTDVAVTGFFRDERPLRAGAGHADWRLCGWLSSLVQQARIVGERGERVLLPTQGRMRASRLLVLGLGTRAEFDARTHRAAAADATARLVALGAGSAALDLPAAPAVASPDGEAVGLVAGGADALEAIPGRLVLRVLAPAGEAGPLRAALERATARGSRPGVAVRMLHARREAPRRRVEAAHPAL